MKISLNRGLALAATLLSLLSAVHAAPAELRLQDKAPFSPAIRHGTLANGLRFYILRNEKPAQKVELRLVVQAGSLQEDEDQRGLAHVVEHLAFNGTAHFRAHELVNYLQSIGVKMGADLNAFTFYDHTMYVLPVPIDKPGTLEQGFAIMADWAGGISFDAAEIERERKVVQEEARLRKGAGERVSRALSARTLAGSRYLERLPIGTEDSIKNFDPAALKRFYRDWYRPDLMSVIVVGDIAPEEAEQMVRAHFGALVNPPKPRARQVYGLQPRGATDALVFTDAELSANSLGINFSREEIAEDGTLATMRRRRLEAMINSMLTDRLRAMGSPVGDPSFMNGGIGFVTILPGWREFRASGQVTRAGPQVAITALATEAQRAARHGFLQSELDRTRANMLRSLERLYNERENLNSAGFAGELVRHALYGEPVPGLAQERELGRAIVEGITLEDVNAEVKRAVLGDGKRFASYFGTGNGDYVPLTGEQVLARLADAEQSFIAPYREKPVATSLMAETPKGGSVVEEKKNAALGLTEWTLSNGVHVILKPTSFKADEVLMTASRRGGRSLLADGDQVAAMHALPVVREMGVRDFSPAELRRMFAGKSVSAGPGMSDLYETFGGQSGSEDVETMLQLTYLFFSSPRKDAQTFRAYVERQRAQMKSQDAQPMMQFQRVLFQAMFGDHPRAPRLARPEDFDGFDVEKLYALYRARFSSAKDFNFYFVGSFDPEKLRPLVANYLGSLPVDTIATEYRDNGPRPPHGAIEKEVRAGSEPKSFISLSFNGETPYTRDDQLRMRALAEVAKLRLTELLREQMGATYTLNVAGSLSREPYGAYSFSIGIPCGPENVPRLLAATRGELARLAQQGVSDADLDKVKANWIKSEREARKTNGYWLGVLRSARELGTPDEDLLNFEGRVQALKAGDLQRAAQRYFDLQNYVQVVLNPAA